MNGKKLSQQVIWAILITLLLVGCGAPAATPIPPTAIPSPIPPTATPTPTSEPLPGSVPEEIEVTFDGNECTVSGPTELPIGEHSFILNDLSEMNAELWVLRLRDGKTFQYLLDEQGERGGPGVWWPKPSWVVHARHTGGPLKNANGGEVWTYLADIEGDYVIMVGEYTPASKRIWFCPPLKVIETLSE